MKLSKWVTPSTKVTYIYVLVVVGPNIDWSHSTEMKFPEFSMCYTYIACVFNVKITSWFH